MFDFIRTNRRFMQFILLVLILPSFTLGGIQVYLNATSSQPKAVIIGKETITINEFNAALENAIRSAQQNSQAQLTVEAINTPELRQQVLDQLIRSRLTALYAKDQLFSVGDQKVRENIVADPMFRDPNTQQFSLELYQSILSQNKISADAHQNMIRSQLAFGLPTEAASVSGSITDVARTRLMNYIQQDRSVSIAPFNFADYADKLKVTDEQIQSYFNENQQDLKIADRVNGNFLLVTEQDIASMVNVTDDEVKAHYDNNIKLFSTLESRHIFQIQVSVDPKGSQETIQAAKDKITHIREQLLQDPSQFAQLAQSQSEDQLSAQKDGDLGWIDAGVLEKDLNAAAFSLEKGQLSEVLQSSFGFHILKVVDIKEPVAQPFVELKQKIKSDLTQQRTQEKFSEISTNLSNLVYSNSTLEEIASQLNLTMGELKQVGRKGEAAVAVPGITDQPKVISALFSPDVLIDKHNSGVIAIDKVGMAVVRVNEFIPAHLPTLDEVRDDIINRLKIKGLTALVQADMDKAVVSIKEGHGFNKLGPAFQINLLQAPMLPEQLSRAILTANVDQLPAVSTVILEHPERPSESVGVVFKISEVTPNKAITQDLLNMQVDSLVKIMDDAESQAVADNLKTLYPVEITPEAQAILKGSSTPE